MLVLLVALNAQKGDLDGNLALHLAMLEKAQSQKCDVAMFPELSLTGSVDPRRHPERALTVDAEPSVPRAGGLSLERRGRQRGRGGVLLLGAWSVPAAHR